MFKNAFWIYITRLVILVLAAVSTNIENFWVRFLILFVAFALFELHDFFSNKMEHHPYHPYNACSIYFKGLLKRPFYFYIFMEKS